MRDGHRRQGRRRSRLLACLPAWLVLVLPTVAAGGSPNLIELVTAQQAVQGISVWHDEHVCWMMQTDGHYVQVRLSEVTSFRDLGRKFQPLDVTSLRGLLRDEFRGMEIESSGNSIVVAPRGQARDLAAFHQQAWREYQDYFRRRGYTLQTPGLPFVTIVHGDYESFARVAASLGVAPHPSLKGFYHPLSNRIVMHADPRLSHASGRQSETVGVRSAVDCEFDPFEHERFVSTFRGRGQSELSSSVASIESVSLLQTLAHEAVHQFGFNTGLHRRVGDNPRWMVEGLAMQFEGEAGLTSTTAARRQRINRERFVWYVQSVQPQQTPELLSKLVSSDDLFGESPLDAYALSWALTFFLIETQRADFISYMETCANFTPNDRLAPSRKVQIFVDHFGPLEVVNDSFRRFMLSLNR